MIRALGVGAFLTQVRAQVQKDYRHRWLRGEVSQLSVSAQGHVYFALKDRGGVLNAVVWAKRRPDLDFQPREGLQVIALGTLTLYAPRGQLQFTVDQLLPDGEGQYFLALEKLKQQLLEEGLFAVARKRALPFLPRRVGVVTSADGAVWHDISTTLERRNPAVQLVLSPAPVQGNQAVPLLILALQRLLERQVEVVILARGGGSWEDLMPFNHEQLVRFLADFPLPVIAAIGHETDVSLCDQIADRRAPTPTAAAEMVAPELDALQTQLRELQGRLSQALQRRLQREREQLHGLFQRPGLRRPELWLDQARRELRSWSERLERCSDSTRRQLSQLRERLQPRLLEHILQRERLHLEQLRQRLQPALLQRLQHSRHELEQQRGLLDTLSPQRVLQRGYSLCLDADGRPLHSVQGRKAGDRLEICLADGSLDCTIAAPPRFKKQLP